MDGFIILLLGGLLTAGIIGFISSIAKGQDEKADAPQEHYNYRLCTFSRILYFGALLASCIMPIIWVSNCGIYPIFLTLFYTSPFFVFLMQNIMAHKLREHNISLHFIAICAVMLFLGITAYHQYTPVCIDGDIMVALTLIYAFVGFYAFFAWIMALSQRNK